MMRWIRSWWKIRLGIFHPVSFFFLVCPLPLPLPPSRELPGMNERRSGGWCAHSATICVQRRTRKIDGAQNLLSNKIPPPSRKEKDFFIQKNSYHRAKRPTTNEGERERGGGKKKGAGRLKKLISNLLSFSNSHFRQAKESTVTTPKEAMTCPPISNPPSSVPPSAYQSQTAN